MTTRFYTALVCGATAVFTALCIGSKALLMLGLLPLLLLPISWLSVFLVWRTLRISNSQAGVSVLRGDAVDLEVTFTHRGFLPVAPLRATLISGQDAEAKVYEATVRPGHPVRLSLPFFAAHVGASTPGVQACEIRDLFGFFSKKLIPRSAGQELLVLPATFEVEDIPLAIGDSIMETVARATEDITNPSDVREYTPGDALKKVHWKLSARRQALMVRRFEEPVMPDTLVLVDCSTPPAFGHSDAEADVRDTILETAASVMAHEIDQQHSPRMPLLGEHPVECDKSMSTDMIAANLARVDFSQADRFDRVLMMETRRMCRVGATIAVAARLNGRIVEALSRLRRMGPYVRLYLVTFTPDDPQLLPFISRLQHVGIEVRYVTPNPA